MPVENRCPTCGTILPEGGKCPFCTEALRLVQQLASAEEVRLCRRCGAVLQDEDEGDLCARCRRSAVTPPPTWRREDRIARWLREHVVEPPLAESERRCLHCGKTIPIHSLFCLYCGKPVAEAVPSQGAAPGPTGGPVFPRPEEVSPGEEVVSDVPAGSPFREVGEAASGRGVSGRSTFLHRVRTFWREQFGPLLERGPGPSPRPKRVSRGVGEETGSQAWLWVLVGLLLLGLVGIAFFWMTLLGSGGIAFR